MYGRRPILVSHGRLSHWKIVHLVLKNISIEIYSGKSKTKKSSVERGRVFGFGNGSKLVTFTFIQKKTLSFSISLSSPFPSPP
jgi:hypothetical protein